MTSKDIHKGHIQEHLQEIQEAVSVGLEKRSSTIALHTSACSIDLIELYLHCLNKVSIGTMIKHEWFKSPKLEQKIAPLAERMIPVEFPKKQEIFSLMYVIEEKRNKLIYGKPSASGAEMILTAFKNLYNLIKTLLQERGEEIE